MLRSIKQTENAQLGVAPTGEPALLASEGQDARSKRPARR